MSSESSLPDLMEWMKVLREHTANRNLGNRIFNAMHRNHLIRENETIGFVRDKVVIFDEEQNMYYCFDLKEKDKRDGVNHTMVRRMVCVIQEDEKLEEFYLRITRGQEHSFQQSLERALQSLLQPYITPSRSSYNIKFTSTSEEPRTVEYNCRAEDFDPKAIREKLIENNFLIHILFHQPFEISITWGKLNEECKSQNGIAAYLARFSLRKVS